MIEVDSRGAQAAPRSFGGIDMIDSRAQLAGRFAGVDTWIFDLDNTLYPPHSRLFDQVDARMGAFISKLLGIDRDAARRLQKAYYRDYGTTMRGLMIEHGVDPHAFLAYVHDIDHSPLEADPALGAALSLLPGRKFVLTNGSRVHAERVLARLGIAEHFEELFDIVAAEFEPKPASAAYERFLTRHGVRPEGGAMFEDLARNLEVPHRLGMRTVLVIDGATDGLRLDWERAGRDAPHIDHVTDDLADLLVTIAETRGMAPAAD